MISIECAELLSFSQNLVNLGDVISYKKEKNYEVRGRLSNYSNFDGTSGIFSQSNDQIRDLIDYEEIFLNGESFGYGFISAIDYTLGADVRDKKYSIAFTVYEKLDLFNVYGEYYSGVSGIQAEDTHLLKSISESWNFDKKSDQTFEYSRNLSIEMLSGAATNPTQTAKNLANILFNNDLSISGLDVFYPNYSQSGNKIYEESYSLFDLSYSFSESFAFQSGDPFIWRYAHSVSKEGGSTSVNEKGSIVAAAKPKITSAMIGFDGSIIGVYERCSGVFDQYAFVDDIGCPLINSPTNQQISFNEFLGSIDYDISYSNDDVISTGCITKISHSISHGQNQNSIINEKVEIKGLGQRTYPLNQRYENAKNCYQNILSSSDLRISGISSGVAVPCCSGFQPIKFSIADSESEGFINYSRDYSCNDSFKVEAPFTQVEYDVSISEGVPLHQTFRIIGFGEEVIGGCKSGNSTLSAINTNVSIRSSGSPSLQEFLDFGYQYIEKPESGHCGFIQDASYGFSSREKRFNLNVGYSYVKHKELFDKSIG